MSASRSARSLTHVASRAKCSSSEDTISNFPIGRAVALWEETDGLHGTFIVRESALGDEVLADVLDGYLPACSVGFKPTTVGRGQQGETVVMAGDLREVSLLPIGAYDSAKVLALRRPTDQPGLWMPRTSAALSRRRRQLGQLLVRRRRLAGWPRFAASSARFVSEALSHVTGRDLAASQRVRAQS